MMTTRTRIGLCLLASLACHAAMVSYPFFKPLVFEEVPAEADPNTFSYVPVTLEAQLPPGGSFEALILQTLTLPEFEELPSDAAADPFAQKGTRQ